MVNKFRKIVASYINQNKMTNNWEEIRILFSVYSYVSFLVVAIKNIVGKTDHIKQYAISLGLESKENIEHIFSYSGTEKIADEIAKLLMNENQIDINYLYQLYLSADYFVSEESVDFLVGKNNRDILGSYYTEEDFAYKITKKAIEEYLANCSSIPEFISIADFSCGGGAFLVSAQKICKKKKIKIKLLGVDVDPIATMITRSRVMAEQNECLEMKVLLGNPLIQESCTNKVLDAFIMALKGRYYNQNLALNIYKLYDVVIGNPPWEKIRFEEKKFLSHYMSANQINSKKNRLNSIKIESEENKIFYSSLVEDYEKAKIIIKNNDTFLDTRRGELNTYALFTEYALKCLSQNGIVGLIVKSSLLKMPVYSDFMKHSMVSKILYEAYMFVNRKKIFNIDSREEFSVIYYKNKNKDDLRIAVDIDDFKNFYMNEKIVVTYEMLKLLNPETAMLPNIKKNDDLKFLCNIYTNNPIFGIQYKDCHFGRLVHLTNHSQYIVRENQRGYLPVYEGKFIELYTGNYATFKNMDVNKKYKDKAIAFQIKDISIDEYPESRFYIRSDIWDNLSKNFQDKYIIAWRSLTAATNRRTMLATVLPLIPTCQSIQLLQLGNMDDMLQILALFNSIVFDYIVRMKMAGLDLTQTIIKQIPVPQKEKFESIIIFQDKEDTIRNHIYIRMKYLYYNDKRVSKLFDGYGIYESTGKSRKQIIAELDLLVGSLYGLSKKEIKEIAKTFDKYYSNEEVEQWF